MHVIESYFDTSLECKLFILSRDKDKINFERLRDYKVSGNCKSRIVEEITEYPKTAYRTILTIISESKGVLDCKFNGRYVVVCLGQSGKYVIFGSKYDLNYRSIPSEAEKGEHFFVSESSVLLTTIQ